MGYSDAQCHELEETINRTPCDLVLVATPVDLARLLRLNKPSLRVNYEIEERTRPGLGEILARFTEECEGRAPAEDRLTGRGSDGNSTEVGVCRLPHARTRPKMRGNSSPQG